MNHNVYHIEKQTFHFGGTGCNRNLLFPLCFQPPSWDAERLSCSFKKVEPGSCHLSPCLVYFRYFRTLLLSLLWAFLIAENGVISSRVTRYLTLPLRRQDYYKIKARIFFEKFGVLLLTLIAMFHISFLGYRLPLSLWKRSLPELILTCCFLFFAAILIFAGYLFHDLYCLKHHH